MKGKPQVLCVGRDVVLNRTRRLILEKSFEVKVAQNVGEALALLSGQRFDLALLCHSLSESESREVVEFVHRLPSPIRILALSEGRDSLLLGPQDDECVSAGPADLLKKVMAMAGSSPPGAKEPGSDAPTPETLRGAE
ncbi:MAG TPA: hypothetical protein VL990_16545 [Acidobacteriaceae bacterium]|nr:hypothetical protein [Acidobacteriaceae bacterium]